MTGQTKIDTKNMTNKQFSERIQRALDDLIILGDKTYGRKAEMSEVMMALLYMYTFNIWAMQLQVKKMARKYPSQEKQDERNKKFQKWLAAQREEHAGELGVPVFRDLAMHYRKLYNVAVGPPCDASASAFMHNAAWAHKMLLAGVGDKEKTATLIKTYWEKAHAETERKTGD